MVCTIITPAYAAGIFLPEESNTKQTESTDLIEAPSGILMEAQTGTVVYQKDADTRRSPASITKIMTLILIFDALDKGSLKMDDTVTTSVHAKSMGGSQVFLEEGEIQTVETLIKCIVIASGNDASVAMAEHICGSEQEFVRHMNERAEGLGMKNTHFEDCCGLTESPDHYTTARDIAIMSRELITKYPKILEYSSIWMENITHVTRQGTKEFGLTNTNKLIRKPFAVTSNKSGSFVKARVINFGNATLQKQPTPMIMVEVMMTRRSVSWTRSYFFAPKLKPTIGCIPCAIPIISITKSIPTLVIMPFAPNAKSPPCCLSA